MSQVDTIYADEISKGNFLLQENNCYQTTRCDSDVNDSDVKNEEIIRSRSQKRLCALALAFLIILLISIVIAGFAVAFVEITNLKSEITHLPSAPALEKRISILNDQYELIERMLNTSSDMLNELSQNYSALEYKTMPANNIINMLEMIQILNDRYELIERMLNTSSDILKELSQNYSALENKTVPALEMRISILNEQYELIERMLNISVHGVIYTRWGKSACRSGVNQVYAGRTGSNYHAHSGGGANYICMPNDPEYSSYFPGVQGRSHVYGTEYEGPPIAPGREQHNAPCAVCDVSNKSRVLMIPAKLTCPSDWTREYYGYLMADSVNAHGRTMYTCVDHIMESIPGSQNHTRGGHFYHVEADCNGVACPPYNDYKELTCVVCSK